MTDKRRKSDTPIYKVISIIIPLLIGVAVLYGAFKVVESKVSDIERRLNLKEEKSSPAGAAGAAYAAEIENFRWKNQERINLEIKEFIKEMQKEIKQIQIILGKNAYAKLKKMENH